MIIRNIEIPIGTEIIVQDIKGNRVKAICKEGNEYNCLKCIFCGNKKCNDMICQAHFRSDEKHAYFEQIDEKIITNFSTGN